MVKRQENGREINEWTEGMNEIEAGVANTT